MNEHIEFISVYNRYDGSLIHACFRGTFWDAVEVFGRGILTCPAYC